MLVAVHKLIWEQVSKDQINSLFTAQATYALFFLLSLSALLSSSFF